MKLMQKAIGFLVVFGVLTVPLVAQTYNLEWSVMSSGGNEGDDVTSSSYRISSVIGQGTAVGDTNWMSSSSYLVHPGFRKVDLDWRPPFTQLVGTVVLQDTITTDTVLVQWTGQDTTTEEGPGWGIWVYDVQYKVDTASSWTDWYTATTDTYGTLTGLANAHWYYFRVRAHDLATNVADWDTILTSIVAIDSIYVNTAVYTLELHTTDELCSLWVDGTAYPAPYIGTYSGGAVVNVEVPDSANFGDTIIAVFDHWAVSGLTDTNINITMDDNKLDTAVYNLWYSLDITSAYDTPVPNGHNWYAEGDSASGYITTPVIDLGDGNLVVCTGFTGTGSAPSIGSGTSFYIPSMDEPSTITWTWDTIPDTATLCTLIVFSPYGHPMPADTTVYPAGTSIFAQVESPVVVGADTHYCTGWLGGGSAPDSGVGNSFSFTIYTNSWIVWQWDSETRLPLTVENDGVSGSDPDGYDSPTPTVGLHYYPIDTLITASVTSPADGMRCAGYVGSGSLPFSADSATSVSFYLSEPTSIHWIWYSEDTTFVCLTVWSEYDSPDPPMGTTCYPINTDITATVTSPADGHNCTGYVGTGSVPTDTSGTDPTPWEVSFTLTENSQLVWVWDDVVRYPLVVENEGVTPSDPDGYDSPTPTVGVSWYDAGSVVNCSVTSPSDGMQCVGHYGWGSVTTDSSTNFSFVITEPSGVSWHWEPEGETIVYLTVYSEYGDPEPPVGTMGYVSGTVIDAWVQDSVYDGATWHHNIGWRGAGSVPDSGDSNHITFTITEDSWIVWEWDTVKWPFEVISAHGSPTPSVGTHWFYDGDTVVGYVDPVDGSWRCVGYAGWGDLDTNVVTHFEFVITQPSGVEWLWENESSSYRVIVRKSPESDTWGGIYINGTWYNGVSAETLYVTGSTVLNFAVSNPDMGTGSRYLFTGWSDGTTDTNRTETITADAEFVANYDYQHQVVIQKSPSEDTVGTMYIDGTPITGSGSAYQEFWWSDGSTHDIAVSSYDSTDGRRYTFTQWADGVTDTARSETISAPDTFVAQYAPQYLIVIEKRDSVSGNLETHGCIYPPSDTVCGVGSYAFWVDGGNTITFAVSKKDTVGDSLYTFYRWDDGGTDTVHSSVTVDGPDTFVAWYEGLEYVICLELWQHGDTPDTVVWVPTSDTIIDPSVTYSMDATDMITVRSCGNVDEQLWLAVISCTDTLGSDVGWSFTMSGGSENEISLRARFENSTTPPTTYMPSLDYIKLGTFEAATDASEDPTPIFGPYGGRLAPSQDLYLFFQLVAPSRSGYYGKTTIKVGLKATIRIP